MGEESGQVKPSRTPKNILVLHKSLGCASGVLTTPESTVVRKTKKKPRSRSIASLASTLPIFSCIFHLRFFSDIQTEKKTIRFFTVFVDQEIASDSNNCCRGRIPKRGY